MGYHTFDPDKADRLDDPERYRYCSRDEVIALLGPDRADRLADFGSGTGFYTTDFAPFVGQLDAVDLQAELHHRYRERGVPPEVNLVTADVGTLPMNDQVYDAAVSTMTFHEVAAVETLFEIQRTLKTGASFIICDWAASGKGEAGPPLEERFTLNVATDLLEDAGFSIRLSSLRPETFLLDARA